jgi:FO synthase
MSGGDRLSNIEPRFARILHKALDGGEVNESEGAMLFGAEGRELDALLATADRLRCEKVGDDVTFAIVRNINFTNICYTGCRFCAFAKHHEDPESEFLSLEEIADRVEEARLRGATEVCLQGGLAPEIDGFFYRDVLTAIKRRVPDIHIHAFSPFEIKYGADRCRMRPSEFLQMLKDHGLGTIPGTAAEILDTDVRRRLTKNKLSTEEWIEIVTAAHRLGIRSTSTIMYGHIDAPHHWAAHIALIRDIQKRTGGFTEFVPLGFIHWNTPIFLDGEARPGPTTFEHLRMHAVARIMLNNWIDNVQVSWVKLGPSLAQRILDCGANDFGGTLMNESISRAAGGEHGQELTPLEMCRLIRGIGRLPRQRNTTYETVEVFEDHDPPACAPLFPLVASERNETHDARL